MGSPSTARCWRGEIKTVRRRSRAWRARRRCCARASRRRRAARRGGPSPVAQRGDGVGAVRVGDVHRRAAECRLQRSLARCRVGNGDDARRRFRPRDRQQSAWSTGSTRPRERTDRSIRSPIGVAAPRSHCPPTGATPPACGTPAAVPDHNLLTVWDTTTGEQRFAPVPVPYRNQSVAIDVDGSSVASAGAGPAIAGARRRDRHHESAARRRRRCRRGPGRNRDVRPGRTLGDPLAFRPDPVRRPDQRRRRAPPRGPGSGRRASPRGSVRPARSWSRSARPASSASTSDPRTRSRAPCTPSAGVTASRPSGRRRSCGAPTPPAIWSPTTSRPARRRDGSTPSSVRCARCWRRPTGRRS